MNTTIDEKDLQNIIDAVEFWRDNMRPPVEEILAKLFSRESDNDKAKYLETQREKFQSQQRARNEDATLLLAKLITLRRNMLDRGGKMTIDELIGDVRRD